MRIAVLNPVFLLQNQDMNFNGYNYVFFERYVSVIYCTDIRRFCSFQKVIINKKWKHIKIVLNIWDLNKSADVLISFNGLPYKFQHRLPRLFNGMKVVHVMDYVYEPEKSEKALVRADVDYILGYCNHGKYCDFFKSHYHYRDDKMIVVPFGFGSRFKDNIEFQERKNKAIALGSVNPVKDKYGKKSARALTLYEKYYSEERFTHKLRRSIVENREAWQNQIDDELPTYPETKNPYYNPVDKLNEYMMFINDAGLLNFPPARTYEGIACGCVMVAEDLEIFHELGFINHVNCILFEKGNYMDMIDKINYYIENPKDLQLLHDNSLILAGNYTHTRVADNLFNKINICYKEWKLKNDR